MTRRAALAWVLGVLLALVLAGTAGLLAALAVAAVRLVRRPPARIEVLAGTLLTAMSAPVYLLTRADSPTGVSADFAAQDAWAARLAAAGLVVAAFGVLGNGVLGRGAQADRRRQGRAADAHGSGAPEEVDRW